MPDDESNLLHLDGKGKRAVEPHVLRGYHLIKNGRKFMSDYNNKCVCKHVLSYRERGMTIQSKMLSEYRCYTLMVLRGPRKQV